MYLRSNRAGATRERPWEMDFVGSTARGTCGGRGRAAGGPDLDPACISELETLLAATALYHGDAPQHSWEPCSLPVTYSATHDCPLTRGCWVRITMEAHTELSEHVETRDQIFYTCI